MKQSLGGDEARLFEEFGLAVNAIEQEVFNKHIRPELSKLLEENRRFHREQHKMLRKVHRLLIFLIICAILCLSGLGVVIAFILDGIRL